MNGLRLWQCESLSKEAAVKHFITDRSTAEEGKEFTLSYSSSPDREEIQTNRSRLAAAMGVGEHQLYLPSQVHKTNITRVSSHTEKQELMETDALITNEKGLCIAVLAADCVPILLYDRKNAAVGAVHSGWRGTVAHILKKTLQEMQSAFGTRGTDLLACIGPSVCQESYEVGPEVVQEVEKAFGAHSDLLNPQAGQKARLDLWMANKMQLQEFGVKDSAIEITNLCTVKNNQHFFSARKGDSGRFAAGIMLV
ncbi:YfiH family protein [Flammeovirgaceae bacterium 311]|nr:YfiH family protein [Flammeovirgaceae bacterium 311]